MPHPSPILSGPRTVRMLFDHTMQAVRERRQTVTRRFGPEFADLKTGDIIEAVQAGWMVNYDGRVPVLAILEVVSVRKEALRRLTDDPPYGENERALEGLPAAISVRARVASMISRVRELTLDSKINRIEFRYR